MIKVLHVVPHLFSHLLKEPLLTDLILKGILMIVH